MVPPPAPSAVPPSYDSPRISLDQEEESTGLLRSYHALHGDDYPPPPSPPNLGVPFSHAKPATGARWLCHFRRPFLALAAFTFLAVFLSASTFNHYQPRYSRTDARVAQRMRQDPTRGLDKAKFRVEPAGTGHTVTAIVLHGLGQPNNEPPFVRKLAHRFPYVKWVSPTADRLNVSVRGFEPTSAWFNIETFDDLSQGENVDEFVHSQQQLNKLVNEEKAEMTRDGKEPRIALMGFSQGAVMTMLALLTANETNRFEGGIALSGYVPLLDDLDHIVSPAARDIPLFWGHGKQDPYLTIEQARSGSKLLRSSRVGLRKLQFNEYDGLDHIWNEEELDDVVDWFARTIPRGKIGRPTFRTSPPSTTVPSPPSPTESALTNDGESLGPPDIEELIRIKEEETQLEAARWVEVVQHDGEDDAAAAKTDTEEAAAVTASRRRNKRYAANRLA
ncbi:hypothetical protein JCM11491_000175 [Sporobolomyces phaffii]